ncbi:histone acetyltransferase MCC1-like [Canna indica]|uniref:N-alpha-acetyltransferase 60 n=1 Tax=Canna indica TaxID=4628 RepID=A0AAQ3KBG5_9LILI|nr:histone acetyltransferase MCC1-like [Canna indica]
MLEPRGAHRSTIVYRPVLPSDLEVLEQIHVALFPIRYEKEFFLNVVRGNGIVSWAAVDISHSDSHNGKLVGFVTTRLILAKESEITDLLRFSASKKDITLVYILTLGVVEHYRNHGIATSLVREVIKYASSITHCRAVYLHVISYNLPAIKFYEKMSFKLMRRLQRFYYINGQHYDSYLFVYYVNDGHSPCSPLNIVAAVATYFRDLFKMLVSKLWRNEERHIPRWPKCKETNSLLITQNKRIVVTENSASQCV